tara:strand:+ start:1876 stop:2205 length:330 start_codon:yes stop_codon:yes gene_type:complete
MNLGHKSVLIAILASIPATAQAQCPPTEELNPCELALFETATILDGRNKEQEVLLDSCNAKLQARTSTVIKAIVQPCPILEKEEEPWLLYITTLTTSLLVGFITGLIMR